MKPYKKQWFPAMKRKGYLVAIVEAMPQMIFEPENNNGKALDWSKDYG